jgi:hypothetical protein
MPHAGGILEDIDSASLARLDGDVPFEFVGQIARASALTEAGHVEGGAAAARHCRWCGCGREGDGMVVDGVAGVAWSSGMAEWEDGSRKSSGKPLAQPLSVSLAEGTEAARVM